jgi:hypothetical protein
MSGAGRRRTFLLRDGEEHEMYLSTSPEMIKAMAHERYDRERRLRQPERLVGRRPLLRSRQLIPRGSEPERPARAA